MNKKTNNDVNFLQLKRDIRIHAIEIAKNKKVLNLFSGENVLWNGIVEDIDNFDIKSYDGKNIKGDAKKVIRSLNLSNYGIIDIDCYGSSFEYLDFLINNEYKGVILITDIQIMPQYRSMNLNLLKFSGISNMYKKCPILFSKFKNDYLFNYLYEKNIREIFGIVGKKCYFCIDLQ